MPPPPRKKIGPLVAALLVAITVALWWLAKPAPASGDAARASAARAAAASPVVAANSPAAAPVDVPDDLKAALNQRDPRQRAQEFSLAFQRWVQADLESALGYLRQMRRGGEYSQALFMLLMHLSRVDPVRAIAVARELIVSRDERGFYSALFDQLARTNLQLALEQVSTVPPGEARENAIRAVADVWVRRDFAAAHAWAEKLADENERSAALETTLRELASRDARESIRLARKLLRDAALERILLYAVQMLTMTDTAAASDLVQDLPPGDLQTNAALNVARTLAERDVDAALAFAKTLRVDLTQWLALNNIFTVWAQKDPAAVGRYVLEMPPGPGMEFVASHVAMLLAIKPTDAIAWAEALPSEAARAKALIMVASTWAQRSPLEAVTWAMSLREEPLRTHAVTGAHSYWMLHDPAAARAWLQKADLPAPTKSILLRSREISP